MEKQSVGKMILHGVASFLPHLLMTYSLMTLTFFVINIFNEYMAFLTSTVSCHFEIVYAAVTLLTTVTALLQKHVRIPAIVASVCAVALVIPVIRALALGTLAELDFAAFPYIALVCCLSTLVFSIMLIVAQRKAAKRTLAAS